MVSYVIPDGYNVITKHVYHIRPGEAITLPASSGLLSSVDDASPDAEIASFERLFLGERYEAVWEPIGNRFYEGDFSLGRLGEFTYKAHVSPPYSPPLDYDFFMYEIKTSDHSEADVKNVGIVEFFVMEHWAIPASDQTLFTALHSVDFTADATIMGDAKIDTLILSELPSDVQDRIVWSRDNDTVLLSLNEHTITAENVERLQFSSGTLAFDTDGHAGQAYRLYHAAFDREPDAEGLKYWIGRLDAGKADLNAIADSFLHSPEFVQTYGTTETVSNADFVALLYTHTLDREHDQDGFDYWVNRLDAGITNRGNLVAFFSESKENVARVAPDIQDGIWLF